MSHDSVSERARQLPAPTQQQLVTYVTQKSQALVPAGRGRGKPATLTTLHLCLGIVRCGIEGFGSQLKLWRRLCLEPMGPFAPVHVVDQAVYNSGVPCCWPSSFTACKCNWRLRRGWIRSTCPSTCSWSSSRVCCSGASPRCRLWDGSGASWG
jgi:hypothetical protein